MQTLGVSTHLTADARGACRSCSIEQNDLALHHPIEPTMFRRVVHHHSRLWTQCASTACCPSVVGTNAFQRPTSHVQNTVVNVLQPILSLQHHHRHFSNAQISQHACWQCGCELESSTIFFCPMCKAILPPKDGQADFFRLMGL